MTARTDEFDLARLSLSSGEGRELELAVGLDPLHFAGQDYAPREAVVPVRLGISRTTHSGYALRLRFAADLAGPCFRCLEEALAHVEVESREVHQPGGGEDLESPYVDPDDVLDLHAWARDALVLALPAQIVCREDCAGLCPVCGANLNADHDHAHEPEPDPRWAKLRELKLD